MYVSWFGYLLLTKKKKKKQTPMISMVDKILKKTWQKKQNTNDKQRVFVCVCVHVQVHHRGSTPWPQI